MTEEIPRQKMDLIASTFLFHNLDETQIRRIITDTHCREERYPKGRVIFDRTHFSRCLGIVLSGEIRVEKQTSEDRYMKMSTLRPGDCFGAASMFCDREEYATVLTAAKPAEILFLPEEIIRRAMHLDFTVTENYIRYLSGRIWFLNEKISNLTAGTTEQRLASYLLEHSDDTGKLSVSMTELSRLINIGRASLYRAMDSLESRGCLTRNGKEVEISNREALWKITHNR